MGKSEAVLELLGQMPRGSWDWIGVRAMLDVVMAEEFPGSIPVMQLTAAKAVNRYNQAMADLAKDPSKDNETFRKEVAVLQSKQKEPFVSYMATILPQEYRNALNGTMLPRSEAPVQLYGLNRIDEFRDHVARLDMRGNRP